MVVRPIWQKIMSELSHGPRIGGAFLESLMLARQSLPAGLSRLIPRLIGRGEISFPELCVENDMFQYTDVPDLSQPNLMSMFGTTEWRSLALRAKTVFHDVSAELTVTAYRETGVIVASTLEDMIWGYAESVTQMNFARLIAFTDLCRRVADELDVSCVLLGSEPCLPSEFAILCSQSDRSPASSPEEAFSKDAVLKLYEWYRDQYAPRWQ
jgi:hypothetical protein